MHLEAESARKGIQCLDFARCVQNDWTMVDKSVRDVKTLQAAAVQALLELGCNQT